VRNHPRTCQTPPSVSASETVGLVGFGRFGAALASLCESAGIPVRAYDSHREPPSEVRVSSLEALCSQASLIVVAVPLDQMERTFAALTPHLRPEQVVLDVGSVKVQPAEAMERHFGSRIPWVATHPLFGPVSLAEGERPLRVVVCPNPLHPAAVQRVTAFFTALGCTPMPQQAEAHDQEMALTHAMAFFVAKGMLDAGVPTDSPHAPPSFRQIARGIEAVQGDAGHLFATLHRRNPYTAAARARLLETLSAADRQLSTPEPDRVEPELRIPDLGAHSPALREARELIDELDTEILTLLARRAELARRAAKAKAEKGFGVADPQRERGLLAVRRERAAALGLDPDAVEEIFQAVLRFSRAVQR